MGAQDILTNMAILLVIATIWTDMKRRDKLPLAPLIVTSWPLKLTSTPCGMVTGLFAILDMIYP